MEALLATATEPTTGLILGVIFCAVIVRAAFGFGDVLVSVPILSLVVGPRLVVPLMGLVGATNALFLLLAERRSVHWRPVRFLLMASVLGVPIGVALLGWLPEATINAGLGGILVVFCLWSLSGRRALRLEAPGWALPFGFCAGVMGGAVTATGPPIVAYSTTQDWDPSERRATMQGFFLPNSVLIVVSHGLAGLWTAEVLRMYLLAVPVCLTALPVGRWLSGRIRPARFELFTFVVLLGTGLLLVLQ